MAYTRGNLAVKEKTSGRGQALPKYKETTKVVTRRAPLPVGEKLLYIFTVVFCVAVASLLIWQNAKVYDLKYQVHRTDYDISKVKQKMSALEVKKQQLEQAVLGTALQMGYQQPGDSSNGSASTDGKAISGTKTARN
ncbi:Cell division protein FtsL [compost metagenome]